MRTKLFLASALFLVVTSALGQSPERFDGAKKLLAGIHEEFGHLETVYCGCPYVRKGRSGGYIDREACGLKGRKCCLKPGVDPEFFATHNDPHNLFPSGGEVDADRLNHPYRTVHAELRAYTPGTA